MFELLIKMLFMFPAIYWGFFCDQIEWFFSRRSCCVSCSFSEMLLQSVEHPSPPTWTLSLVFTCRHPIGRPSPTRVQSRPRPQTAASAAARGATAGTWRTRRPRQTAMKLRGHDAQTAAGLPAAPPPTPTCCRSAPVHWSLQRGEGGKNIQP